MKQLACGACGGYKFRLYAPDHNRPSTIRVDCVECDGFTMLRPPDPEIVIDHSTDSAGTLCHMGTEPDFPWCDECRSYHHKNLHMEQMRDALNKIDLKTSED